MPEPQRGKRFFYTTLYEYAFDRCAGIERESFLFNGIFSSPPYSPSESIILADVTNLVAHYRPRTEEVVAALTGDKIHDRGKLLS